MYIPTTTLTQAGGESYWDVIVRKATTQSVASSTAVQADTELLFAVAAGTAYFGELVLLYDADTGSGTPDLKHNFAISAGSFSLGWRQHVGVATNGAIQNSQVADMTSDITNGTAAQRVFRCGFAFTATNDATATFMWAQNVSDPLATRVLVGSTISYRALV